MSKYVKHLITENLRERLQGVNDALLVNVIGLKANANHRLRSELQNKRINLLVVKNSLAARAVAGTPLAPMFEGLDGTAAVCWGADDIVALAKEITRLAKDEQYGAFTARGGVVDGQRITDTQVADVAKWPSRTELLSIVAGQILSPGAVLVGQLMAVGGALASQIKERGKGGEEGEASAPEGPAAPEEQAAAEEPAAAEGQAAAEAPAAG